jgi:hypothetical protein
MVDTVSKIDTGFLKKDQRAWNRTEWTKIACHSIPDSVDFERMKK